MKKTITALAAGGLLATSTAGATVIFSGTSGSLSASASFTISAGTLTILLSNTAANAPNSASTLSGLFWSFPGAPTLSTVGATATGAAIAQTIECNVTACSGGPQNVGGEWSYAQGGLASLLGTNEGISSSGYLNANADAGNLNGPVIHSPPPSALNGIDLGIVPAGFVDFSGNSGLDNDPLIKGSATFTFLNIPAGLTEQSIGNVFFTYGTSQPGEPNFPGDRVPPQGVPEPGSLALLGGALVALLAIGRRRKT